MGTEEAVAVAGVVVLMIVRQWYHHCALITDTGGHLGWCDAADPTGPPAWVQDAALDFLDAAALRDADRNTMAARAARPPR